MGYKIALHRNKAGQWELVMVEERDGRRVEARRLLTSLQPDPARNILLKELSHHLRDCQQTLRDQRT